MGDQRRHQSADPRGDEQPASRGAFTLKAVVIGAAVIGIDRLAARPECLDSLPALNPSVTSSHIAVIWLPLPADRSGRRLAQRALRERGDGFSIGSNQMTTLTLTSASSLVHECIEPISPHTDTVVETWLSLGETARPLPTATSQGRKS